MGKYVLHYKDEAVYEIEADSEKEAIAMGDQYWAERVVPVEVEEVKNTSRSRLDKINAYKGNEEFLKATAEQKVQDEASALVAQIRALKPRIDELLEVGNACLANGIPMEGKAFGGHEGYDTHQFITNGWSHLLGFVSDRELNTRKQLPFTKLGIHGGGACYYNLETDGVTVDVSGKEANYVLSRFVKEFEKFENEFFKYVDKVIEKQQGQVDKIIADAQGRVQDAPVGVGERELDI